MGKQIPLTLLLAIAFSVLLIDGCVNPCPAKEGQTYCGHCDETTSNPHGGQCRYCPEGYSCSGDICGEMECMPGDGSGGGGNPDAYYVSCGGCGGAYGSYSYMGSAKDICKAYYQTCEDMGCDMINENCAE